MADNKMEKSIKEAIGKSLNEFNKKIGMAKIIKDNKNQDRILKGILSQVNDENTEKTEKSNVITLDNSTDGIVELKEIKGDTNVNVSKMEKETPITHVIDDKYGNVISLDGITEGVINIDDIEGNTMVNCCKDSNKELVLNGDIDTQGINNVTLIEGVDGGKVDVSLEGNTMVNVCDQEDPIAITKNYEVTTGNYIALQGEYDGKCRPNIYGNTLVNIAKGKKDYSCSQGKGKETDINLIYNLKAGTTYTLIRTVSDFIPGLITDAITFFDLSYYEDGTFVQDHNCRYTGNGVYVDIFTPKKDVTKMGINIGQNNIDKDNGIYPTITISDYMILEGDYTNKPIPDYFTGMKSSFEDKLVPENLYKFSSRDDFYSLNDNATLDGEYIEMTANSKYQNAMLKPLGTIKPSTTYTIVVDVVQNTLNSMLFITNGSDDAQLPVVSLFQVNAGRTGIFTRVVTTNDDLSGCIRCLVNYLDETNTTGSIKYRIMVVEGDYTKYDFINYDSTKVGKYKVDYKVTGKNKVAYTELGDINVSTGENLSSTLTMRTSYIFLRANHTYYIANQTVEGSEWFANMNYDKDKNFIEVTYENNTTITPKQDMYIRIKRHNPNQLDWKVQLEEGNTATTYEPYKEYTKTVYLNAPLLEGDTIEQSGNDIVHMHRYKTVTFDGSDDENIWIDGASEGCVNTKLYGIRLDNDPIGKDNGDIIANNLIFRNVYNTDDIDGIWYRGKAFRVRMFNSKLATQDLAGFRKYLQQNPITVAYELATPTREVISTNDNLLLDSYVNGHLDVDSVVPIDKVIFQSYGTSLKYLSPNTEYTIQFESDSNGKLDALALNSSDVIGNLNIVKGINKFNITTSDKITINYLWTTGIGFNASKIVITPKVDGEFGYFKGMKSVGQNDVDGHKIEILSSKNITPSTRVIYTANGIEFNFASKSINENVYVHNISNKSIMVHTTINGKYERGFMIVKNSKKLIELKENEVIYFASVNYANGWSDSDVEKARNSFIITKKENELNKKEILMNEPLRGLPNGVRDKYVMINGKWYIERNTIQLIMDSTFIQDKKLYHYASTNYPDVIGFSTPNNWFKWNSSLVCDNLVYDGHRNISAGSLISNQEKIFVYDLVFITLNKNKLSSLNEDGFREYLKNNPITLVGQNTTPAYEPIDYNPFEVYTDTTHISNNSTIPCNMVIKNTGYNCILKPSTLYTVALDTNKSGIIGINLGGGKGTISNNVTTITTPATLTDNTLILYGKGIKASGVRLLEGDKTNWIPSHFEGMKSCFEDKLQDDGKYKMEILMNNKNLFNSEIFKDLSKFKVCLGTPDWRYYPIYVGKSKKVYLKRNYKDGITEYPMVLVSSYKDYGMNIGGWLPIIHPGYREKYYEGYILSDDLGFVYIQTPLTDYKKIMNTIENCIICTEDISYEPCIYNKIQFLLNEPLRAVGNSKDKVYIKEDKIVVERNCGSVTFDGSDTWNLNKIENNIYTYSIRSTKFLTKMKVGTWETLMNNKCYIIDKCGTATTSTPKNEQLLIHNTVEDKFIWYSTPLFSTVQSVKQYLNDNPFKILYQLAEPVYEEVEFSNNRLTLDSYDNSTLFYDTNIPVSNTSFKPLWEELVYVKNSTTYYIQFNAVGSGDVVVNLGGTELSTTITEGYNKIEIATPNNSTNLLTIDGQGIKISKVVVSEALCSGYYKGLQSCFEEHMENGKYVCVVRGISLDGNKVNGIKFYLNEPLRGIGDIKDRLCIKDGKLMVERNCGSIIFDGSSDEGWLPTGYGGHATRNTFEISFSDINIHRGAVPSISNLFTNEQVSSIPVNDNAFRVNTNAQNSTYFLFTPSTTIIPYRDIAKWKEYLQQNPITIVYQLATSVYEEITNEYGLPIILEGYENGIVYVDSAVTPTTSIKYTSNNTVPTTLSNVDNLNTATQDDINNNIVTYMMDIDMMLTEMEMEDNASIMSLSDSDDNNQKPSPSHNNILDRMNKEDRIKYQDNTTKMLEKVIKGKSLTKEENINRIDLYLSEGKIREEQSNYLRELLKGGE